MAGKKKPTPAEVAAAKVAKEILDVEALTTRNREGDFTDFRKALLKFGLMRAYGIGQNARE